jgi:hypothetical protein
MKEERITEWENPFSYNRAKKDNKHEVLDAIGSRLKEDAVAARRNQESSPATWRWIHCEGLNGDMLKIVANETGTHSRTELNLCSSTNRQTGWPASLFAGVFACWYTNQTTSGKSNCLQGLARV